MVEKSSPASSQSDFDELLPLPYAAELSGLSHSHLRLLVRQRKIWGKRMGRDWFTTLKSIQEYMISKPKPGPKPKE
jgi:hypothetical protein